MNEQILANRPLFPAQLDMSHPLTEDLIGCWVLNENSPNGMRAWDSSPHRNHGTVNTAQQTWGGLLSTSGNVILPANWMPDTGTIIIWHKPIAGGYLLSSDLNEISVYHSNATNSPVLYYQGATAFTQFSDLWPVSSYNFIAITFTVNGSGSIYNNGVFTETATLTVGTPTNVATRLAQGSDGTGNSGGTTALVLIYKNRILTKDEVRFQYANPYDIFLR